MATQPDTILETARIIARDFAVRGHSSVEVRADVFVSINGRENERLVDPEVDLAAACNNLAHKPESTDRGRQVSVLQWPKGAPLNLG